MVKKDSADIRYISLKRASEISGYHPDYLSSLIRKEKIKGRRIGRDWFTTEEAIKSYLSTKRFLSVENLLFSKVRTKRTFIFALAIILIGISAFLISSSPFYSQYTSGDFVDKTELQTESININQFLGEETKEVRVTTYSSDSAGGVEISVQSEPTISDSKEPPSFFQKIKDLLSNIFG
jgi:hypothetical protein